MNHIYKVIWNKAKGCYQVASEFTHQQGRSGSTQSAVKHTAAVLAVVALVGGFSAQAVHADDTQNIKANTVNSKYQLTVGSQQNNGKMPFQVNSSGAFYGATGRFNVDKDGNTTVNGDLDVTTRGNAGTTSISSNGDSVIVSANATGNDGKNHTQVVSVTGEDGVTFTNSDKTMTIINGDHITSGTINGNNITAGNVKADKANIGGISFDGDGAFSTTVSRSMFGGANTLSFNDAGLTVSGTKDDGSDLGTTSILGGTITTDTVKTNTLAIGKAHVDGTIPFTVDAEGHMKAYGADMSGQKITGVAEGTEATDAVNKGQLDAIDNRVSSLDKDNVKWDKDEKGNVTNAIKGVSFDGDGAFSTTVSRSMFGGANTLSFNDAGLTVSGTKDDGSDLGTTSILGGTITTDTVKTNTLAIGKAHVDGTIPFTVDAEGHMKAYGADMSGQKITGVAEGTADTDAVNVKQLKSTVTGMTGMNSSLGNVVQYQKDGSLLVTQGKNALGVDKNGARLVSSNEQNGVGSTASVATSDGSASMTVTNVKQDGTATTTGFTANKDGSNTIDGNTNINGNLNVNGNFSVNGKQIATSDDIADISGSIKDVNTRVDETNKVVGDGKLDNGAADLTAGINKNSASITTINSQIGATGEKGALKLTNGATTVESGINQNTVAIQQNSEAINSLGRGLNHLGQEVDNVGAISAALAGLHPLGYDGDGSKFQIAAAVGTYDGTQAAALGGFYHFNRDVMMSLGASSSFGSDNKTAANLGVTFRVGKGADKAPTSNSEVMKRLTAMDKKIAELEEQNKNLTSVLAVIDPSQQKAFPDVPANHWAYDAVAQLAGNGIVSGYPDGEFHGDRTMTRYEMAELIYKAMKKGAKVDQKLVNEFKPEIAAAKAKDNAISTKA